MAVAGSHLWLTFPILSGLGGTTVSLLASGVVGITMFVATFPAVFVIDKIGRRPLIILGGCGAFFSAEVIERHHLC